MKKIFWCKEEEIQMGGENCIMWKYSSPDNDVLIKSRMKLAGNVARMPKKRKACRDLMGRPERRRQF